MLAARRSELIGRAGERGDLVAQPPRVAFVSAGISSLRPGTTTVSPSACSSRPLLRIDVLHTQHRHQRAR